MAERSSKLGPKMQQLSPLRRAFVSALMNQGDRNATQAAATAGYSQNSYGSLKVQAHTLWHDELVQEAIREESIRRVTGMLPAAVATVGEVMENLQEGGATRLKAAQIVMDRAGVHAVTERINREEPLATNPDQLRRIMELAQRVGIPVEKLLGGRLTAIPAPEEAEDAEYVDLNGLEDLI